MDKVYNYFIQWKARPVGKDDPKTIPEFCERYKITLADTVEFVNRADYQDRLTSEAITWGRSQVPNLLHTAFEEAKLSKDVASIEKFINIVHELKKKKDDKSGNQFNFFNITDDQFKQIARRTVRDTGLLEAGG